MAEFERVAAVDEIEPGGRKSIIVDELPVLLIRVGDQFFAIEDVCTHDGQPLTDGPIDGSEITCPRHGARFDVTTGQALCMPATEPVATYPVEVRDGNVFVKPNAPDSLGAIAMSDETPSPDESPVAGPEQTTPAEAPEASQSDESKLIEALKDVIDPELMINVVDLGLVYSVEQNESKALVEMTLTSPACPVGPQIMQQAKMALERLDGIDEAEIKLVMSPPWSPDRMTDDARDHLGIF